MIFDTFLFLDSFRSLGFFPNFDYVKKSYFDRSNLQIYYYSSNCTVHAINSHETRLCSFIFIAKKLFETYFDFFDCLILVYRFLTRFFLTILNPRILGINSWKNYPLNIDYFDLSKMANEFSLFIDIFDRITEKSIDRRIFKIILFYFIPVLYIHYIQN